MYDAAGRVVSTLMSGNKSAGLHNLEFNSKNLSKGIYYYRIIAFSGMRSFTKTNTLIVLE
jgi:flagellar hook assembly protein FlgD